MLRTVDCDGATALYTMRSKRCVFVLEQQWGGCCRQSGRGGNMQCSQSNMPKHEPNRTIVEFAPTQDHQPLHPTRELNSTLASHDQIHLILAVYSAVRACAAPTAARRHPRSPCPLPLRWSRWHLDVVAPNQLRAAPSHNSHVSDPNASDHNDAAHGCDSPAAQQIRSTGGNRAYMTPVTGLRAQQKAHCTIFTPS